MVSISALGWPSLPKAVSCLVAAARQPAKRSRHGLVEGGELGVTEDRGLHLGQRQLEARVARATGGLEQRGAHAGEHLPVVGERVEIALGDAAAQVALDVLQVLRLRAVDVARQVEVEVVLRVRDLGQRHQARIARHVGLASEGVHDAVDVLLAQAVLVDRP